MAKKMRLLFTTLFLMVLVLSTSGIALASLLYDRGLPTINLNNISGSNRSNVAWVDEDPLLLPGDSAIAFGSSMWHIDTVRLWAVSVSDNLNTLTGLSLWAGSSINSLGVFSTYTTDIVKYADDQTYQGYSGANRTIFQIDFTINQDITAGKYYFFLKGLRDNNNNAFLHASNADLSGSNQDGADDLFQWLKLDATGGILAIQSWDSYGDGWDKSSDANIQVFGSVVPEPATMLLFGLGLLGVAGIGRRKK